MIWRTARDKPKYTLKQRRFHHRVTKFYLAFTLSLFPALALIFIANKVVPLELVGRVSYVNGIFFSGWLVLTVLGMFWNNYRKLNRNYVLIGSILGLTIPIVYGIVTGDWIWNSILAGQYYVFGVDLTWLIIGFTGLLISRYYLVEKENENNMAEVEEEINTAITPKNQKEEPQPVLQHFSKPN